MKRYLETYFRHPWLFLLPALLIFLPAAALAARAALAEPLTVAETTVAVSLDPASARPDGARPSTERNLELLGELMRTDSFILNALARTSLGPNLEERGDAAKLAQEVRAGWRQAAGGANTMRLSYACDDGDFCTEVLTAVLAAYRDEVLAARLGEKRTAVALYERELTAAQDAVRRTDPSDPAWNVARANAEQLGPKLVEAKLEVAQIEQSAQSQFILVQAPQINPNAGGRLLGILLPLVAGAVLGLGLSAALVVAVTWFDTTVRTPEAAQRALGVRVIAVAPHVPARRGHGETAPRLAPFGEGARPIGAAGRWPPASLGTEETRRV